MNGCDYEIHGGTEDKAGHFIEVELTLVCPPEKKIEIHCYASAEKHASNEPQCKVTIAQQTVVANTDTNKEGSPDVVELVTSVSSISLEVHPEGLICGKTNQTASYTGSTTLKAYKDLGNDTVEGATVYTEGSQIGLTISDGE